MYFTNSVEGELIVKQQIKTYKNINEYNKDISLIDQQNQNINKITAKNFLKQQDDLKLKPNWYEKNIWIASCLVPIILIAIGVIHTPLLIVGVVSLMIKTGASFFDPWTKKVESRIKQNFSSRIRKIPFLNKKLGKTKKRISN